MATLMETDDPDDIEFGCQVFSRTHQNSAGWVGGVVIDIDAVAGTVTVLPDVWAARGPQPVDLLLDELEMAATRFDTRCAGVAAVQLWSWLATLKAKRDRERHDVARWGELAVRLQTLHDAGPNLPGAEYRYQRARAARNTA